MDLLLATSNPHKTRELAALLGSDFALKDLTSLSFPPRIVENGSTFADNAAIKALALSRLLPGEIVIADDSGLEVEALGGEPGIYSARYAGPNATDQENIERLLGELQSLRNSGVAVDRTAHFGARFRCVIAVAKGGNLLTTLTGDLCGEIVAPPRGTNGFGYDPVFLPQGSNHTLAEMPAELKNRISHRAHAASKLLAFLRTARQ